MPVHSQRGRESRNGVAAAATLLANEADAATIP